MKRISLKKQQGVVLVWALGILIVLTVLGISSMKKANMGTKIAGNSMASMMVFQGAESALSKVSNSNFTFETSKLVPGNTYPVPQDILPNEPVSGGNIKSKGDVTFVKTADCPLTNNANSTSVGCRIYRIRVESRLQGTGAKTEHIMGVASMAAPSGNYIN
ncbi:MAG: pilus assembly PilX family protein [Leucothrix sp.]